MLNLINIRARNPVSSCAWWLCCWLLGTSVLPGCTNAVLRPTFPNDVPAQNVKPFSQYTGDTGGKADKEQKPIVVKTFLVHGMTYSDSRWADTFIQNFSRRVGVDVPPCSSDHQIDIAGSPWAEGPAHLCVVSGHRGTVEYKFYALQWSPLTVPYKCTEPMQRDRDAKSPILSADKPGPAGEAGRLCDKTFPSFATRRAVINGTIKNSVLDDGFPDVIVYLAPDFQPVFWRVVSEGLCRMYSDDPRTDRCALPEDAKTNCGADVPMPSQSQRYVFVTHSLGANILLDTLADSLKCVKEAKSGFESKLGAAIQATFVGPTPFYMLANQYVLLQLHKASETDFPHRWPSTERVVPSTFDIRMHPFFKALTTSPRVQSRGAKTRQAELQVDIVAFSDPNDDLTFLLPSELPVSNGISVQNVLVRGAPEYLFFLEDPLSAHVNYFRKPQQTQVLDVIFCGMDQNGVLPC